MSKYIKEHSLSVGYNNTGQEFFDLINKYKNYIHSYFLSFTESMCYNPYNVDDVVSKLKKCNTYDIPANILFNTSNDQMFDMFIDIAKEFLNLKGVTVLKLSTARKIKEKYPDLEIHLSVRYFDWNKNSVEKAMEDLMKNNDYKIIDVINISGAKSFTDHKLIDFIHSIGIKTKIIVNEGCIVNRSLNYNNFPGFNDCNCYSGPCKRKFNG